MPFYTKAQDSCNETDKKEARPVFYSVLQCWSTHTPLYWEETTFYSPSLNTWARSCTDSGGTSSTPLVSHGVHIYPAVAWNQDSRAHH